MAGLRSRSALRSPTTVFALIVLSLLFLAAMFGRWVYGDAATLPDVMNGDLGPSWAYPFGTDRLGRDIFARCMASTRPTLFRAFASGLAATVVGSVFGIIVSLLRNQPRLRSVLLRVIELGLAFPGLLVAIFVTAILDGPLFDRLEHWRAALPVRDGFSPLTRSGALRLILDQHLPQLPAPDAIHDA